MTTLPVRESVSNYEKISRIGEGTYGVVCKSIPSSLTHCLSTCLLLQMQQAVWKNPEHLSDDSHDVVQIRPETGTQARSWLSRRLGWRGKEMVQSPTLI